MKKYTLILMVISIAFMACEKEEVTEKSEANQSIELNDTQNRAADDDLTGFEDFEYHLGLLEGEQHLLSGEDDDGNIMYTIMHGFPDPDGLGLKKFPYNSTAGRKAAFEYAKSLPCYPNYTATIVNDGTEVEVGC